MKSNPDNIHLSRRRFILSALKSGAALFPSAPYIVNAKAQYNIGFWTLKANTTVLRVTQVYAKALATATPLPSAYLRVSQIYAKALATAAPLSPAYLRATQVYAKTLATAEALPAPSLRVSQVYALVLATAP